MPAWSTHGEAVRLILRGVTFRTAIRMAVVVGTLLTLVNQGTVLLSGDLTGGTVFRVLANYAIPFTVSSLGYLAPFRVPVRGVA